MCFWTGSLAAVTTGLVVAAAEKILKTFFALKKGILRLADLKTTDKSGIRDKKKPNSFIYI